MAPVFFASSSGKLGLYHKKNDFSKILQFCKFYEKEPNHNIHIFHSCLKLQKTVNYNKDNLETLRMKRGQQMEYKESMLLSMLKTGEYTTASALAEQIGFSEKTVRTSLAVLKEALVGTGAMVEMKKGKGYRLTILNEEIFRRFQMDVGIMQEERIPDRPAERLYYLMSKLLVEGCLLNAGELCEFLYISRNTLSSDLKKIEQVLSYYNIALIRKNDGTIYIEGNEFDIRSCLVYRSVRYGNLLIKDREIMGNEFVVIRDMVLEEIRKSGLHIWRFMVQDLLVTVYTTIVRIRQGHLIDETWLKESWKKYKAAGDMDEAWMNAEIMMGLACDIAKEIEARYEIQFPPSELRFLAIELAAKSEYCEYYLEKNQSIGHSELAYEVCKDIVRLLEDETGMSFQSSRMFYKMLYQMVLEMLLRSVRRIPLFNSMKEEIKRKRRRGWQLSEMAMELIQKQYDIIVSEDEIVRLAMLIDTAVYVRKMRV